MFLTSLLSQRAAASYMHAVGMVHLNAVLVALWDGISSESSSCEMRMAMCRMLHVCLLQSPPPMTCMALPGILNMAVIFRIPGSASHSPGGRLRCRGSLEAMCSAPYTSVTSTTRHACPLMSPDLHHMCACHHVNLSKTFCCGVQVTEASLADVFKDSGKIVDCRVCGDPNSAMRFAFIEFADERAVQQVRFSDSGDILAAQVQTFLSCMCCTLSWLNY